MGIRLGGHLFSMPFCTVEEAALIWRALGIDVMDLGNGRDLHPDYVAANVEAEAERIAEIGERTGMAFHDAFPQPTDKHITNTPDPEEYQHQRDVCAAWIRFAARAGLDGVTISPGRYWAGLSVEEAYARSLEQVRYLVDVAADQGVKLRIEPHVESVTWTPELALRMADEVAGLTFTVDHSHFVFHGIPYETIAAMHPLGTHWHARQAGLAKLQAGYDEGEIDFSRIVGDLVQAGYQGVVALELVHTPWLELDRQDVLGETIRLRDHLRDELRSAGVAS